MSDVNVTFRIPKELDERLNAICALTRRSKSLLARVAIGRFVETETEVIEGIKEAQAELRAGLGIPHSEVMRAARATISKAAKSAKKKDAYSFNSRS
jgi:predicted transcriptional regulator